MSTSKCVQVVAAVIRDRGNIIISKRADNAHQGGKWEFPGGKVESGELPLTALARELKEELDIIPLKADPLIQIHYDYPDKSVFLDVWDVTHFEGTPRGMEGQMVESVAPEVLRTREFPQANGPIINAALLPAAYWITPDVASIDDCHSLLVQFQQHVQAGVSLIQLRLKQASATLIESCLELLAPMITDSNVALFINSATLHTLVEAGAWERVQALFAGIHLTSDDLRRGVTPKADTNLRVSASCHDEDELTLAAQRGCEFATLSPLKTTPSHPDALQLDEEQASTWVRAALLPVYGLGGLSLGHSHTLRLQGYQGVAGIRQLLS